MECARLSDQYVAQVADLTALKFEVCQGLGIRHLHLGIDFQCLGCCREGSCVLCVYCSVDSEL